MSSSVRTAEAPSAIKTFQNLFNSKLVECSAMQVYWPVFIHQIRDKPTYINFSF